MARELLASHRRGGLVLDPRTKLALLVTIAVFVLSVGGKDAAQGLTPLLAAVPFVLFLSVRMWRQAALYALLYGGSVLLQLVVLPYSSGVVNFLVIAVSSFFMRFVPGIMMGYLTVKTTTVSEFIAAMERMHLPKQVVIPIAVIFRFFPTIFEEAHAISDAMCMRGVRFGGGKASAMLEYRLVPLVVCTVKIGEELSAAALTRGLGDPVKRTNICQIGFHFQDAVFLALCVAAFMMPLIGMIAGGLDHA